MTSNCTCTVKTCLHNSDNCCCKSEILVDGASACTCGSTCCASFDRREHTSFHNSFESPDPKLRIECNAVKCIYNTDRRCTAQNVDINGSTASAADQTQCSTFTPR